MKDAPINNSPNNQKPNKPRFQFPKINFKGPITITVLVILAIVLIKVVSMAIFIAQMMAKPTPVVTVTTTVAKHETWERALTAVGQLKSMNGALLKAAIAGPVKEISIIPGQEVKAGDLLLVVDAAAERAAAKLAKLNYERAELLRTQSVNTQNDLDVAQANYEQAQAALDKKEIRAPFDGVVGIPQVVLGQYVKAGDPLIAVESKKTMNVDFAVAQGRSRMLAKGAAAELTVDACPGEVFKGIISGIDPRVDEQTLTVNARAEFDNQEGKLSSGMFGSLTVKLKETDEGEAVPGTAVVYSAYGNLVYVAAKGTNPKTKKEELQAQQTFVKVKATQGDYVLLEGIKAGDEVVTTGQVKLRNNAAIKPDNAQALPASKNPHPQES